MTSVEYDNNVYEVISSKSNCNQENEYEVPNNVQSNGCNQPLVDSNTSNMKNRCTIVLLLTTVIVLVLAVVAASVVFAMEIDTLKKEMSRLSTQMLSQNEALSEKLDTVVLQMTNRDMISQQTVNYTLERLNTVRVQVTQEYSNEIQKLASSSNTSLQQLSKNISTSLQQLSESTIALKTLLLNILGNPVLSCASLPSFSPSGYYWVASNSSAVHVYCDMTRSCGGVTGGWMRVGELDMTNSSHQCPSGLRERTSSLRTCVRDSTNAGCSSVIFSTLSTNYTDVCGRVIAYQYGTTDAFKRGSTIDNIYVDGVSLTYGSPRKHIWTFASAIDEVISVVGGSCPCVDEHLVNRFSARIPSFVKNDYFCDTGSYDQRQHGVFYSDDPLWDGAGCERQSTCCSFNNPPWFYKQLSQPTTDDIEMRVCRDEASNNEDIAIEEINLYVR